MKLAERYNRVNLLTSLVVLCLTGVFYYVFIHYILTDKLDKDLLIEEDEITEYVRIYHKLPLAGDFKDQKVQYSAAPAGASHERRFLNTEYLNQKEDEPGRTLVTVIKANGRFYEVTITKSRVESEDLIRVIFLITIGVTAVLLISLIVINRFVLGRLWKPFRSTLAQMQAFTVADMKELQPEPTDIEEFRDLNTAAITMAVRVKQDYRDLKSFTDNASHEMMTPLAVLNSKLDTLLQTGTFSEKQGELIDDVYMAVGRLSRLNQSLLLLAKMENELIDDYEEVAFDELILQKVRQLQELMELKELTVELDVKPRLLRMSKYLADMLLNNLFGNAIRHNLPGGRIRIQLNSHNFSIANTGKSGALDKTRIFNRFIKDDKSEGMGLGLALSRQISVYQHLNLDYIHKNGLHTFILSF